MNASKVSAAAALSAVCLTACANTVSQTMGAAIAGAPDWFGDRREEMSGENYPKLADIPPPPERQTRRDKRQIDNAQEKLREEAQALEADPKSSRASDEERDDPNAWASRVRAEFDPID